jgi:hypothetical protein
MRRLGRAGHPMSVERLSLDDILIDDLVGDALRRSSVGNRTEQGA